MKRPQRKEDGMYHINGKKFRELFGSRQQVMNGTCYKTAGELVKSDLMMNKWGRIVSRKKHATAKKEKRLLKSGYTAKKGKFGYVKVGTKKNRKTRKMRGGGCEDEEKALADAKTEVTNLDLDGNASDVDKTAAKQKVTDAMNALEACKQPPSKEPVEPGQEQSESVEPGQEQPESVEPGQEQPESVEPEQSVEQEQSESVNPGQGANNGGKKNSRNKKSRGKK